MVPNGQACAQHLQLTQRRLWRFEHAVRAAAPGPRTGRRPRSSAPRSAGRRGEGGPFPQREHAVVRGVRPVEVGALTRRTLALVALVQVDDQSSCPSRLLVPDPRAAPAICVVGEHRSVLAGVVRPEAAVPALADAAAHVLLHGQVDLLRRVPAVAAAAHVVNFIMIGGPHTTATPCVGIAPEVLARRGSWSPPPRGPSRPASPPSTVIMTSSASPCPQPCVDGARGTRCRPGVRAPYRTMISLDTRPAPRSGRTAARAAAPRRTPPPDDQDFAAAERVERIGAAPAARGRRPSPRAHARAGAR